MDGEIPEMTSATPNYIALGSRLKGIPEVLTLGVRPNFLDYSPSERRSIFKTPLILYPTRNYAQFLTTLGKRIFPSLETCLYSDEKIKQTTLFYMAGVRHPRTRVYFPLHHRDILQDFRLPFVAKLPRSSSRGHGVFMIRTPKDLDVYLTLTKVAYIQEYLPHERDLRVVLINYQPALAYWRIRQNGNFRTNVSQGGKIGFESIPSDGLKIACEAARKCRLNDVGMDLIHHRGTWYVIEANMKYGRKGLKMKGLDLKQIIRQKLLAGELL